MYALTRISIAFRQCGRKAPGFPVTVSLTLALGIAATCDLSLVEGIPAAGLGHSVILPDSGRRGRGRSKAGSPLRPRGSPLIQAEAATSLRLRLHGAPARNFPAGRFRKKKSRRRARRPESSHPWRRTSVGAAFLRNRKEDCKYQPLAVSIVMHCGGPLSPEIPLAANPLFSSQNDSIIAVMDPRFWNFRCSPAG